MGAQKVKDTGKDETSSPARATVLRSLVSPEGAVGVSCEGKACTTEKDRKDGVRGEGRERVSKAQKHRVCEITE